MFILFSHQAESDNPLQLIVTWYQKITTVRHRQITKQMWILMDEKEYQTWKRIPNLTDWVSLFLLQMDRSDWSTYSVGRP